MSTREQTRRQLKDLAKLAAAMTDTSPSTSVWDEPPTERSSSVPPAAPGHADGSGSRATVPPAVASIPTPRAFTRPPRSFFPPASAVPSPHLGSPSVAIEATTSPSGRGARALMASATLAAAMVGGLLLGQALASHGPPASAKASPMGTSAAVSDSPGVTAKSALPTTAQASATAAGAPAPALAASTPVVDAPSAAAEPNVMVLPSANAATVTVRAPRPAHHAEARQVPVAPPPPANSPAAAKAPPVTRAPASHAAPGHDSLDDLIRKAASN
jgi:hypothetical protein